MAALSPDSIWNLISEHKFTFEATEDLTCDICKELMIDACQSSCGCQFCYKCISAFIANGDRHCPGDKRDCKDEFLVFDTNVQRSPMLNKKISKLIVNCPHESCEFVSELIAMREHLRLCTKQPIACPYFAIGCVRKKSNKDAIQTHLKSDSLIHTEILIELVQNMKNEIAELKESVDNLKSENVSLKEELATVRNEIKITVDEETKKMQGTLNELRVQIEALTTTNNLEKVSFKEELKSNENIILGLKKNLNDLTIQMRDGRLVGKNVNNEMKQEIIIESCPNNTGNFRWCIEQCSQKINVELFSESFYANNYKLNLYARISYSDNIWLHCCILKGDNDDELRWPMRQTVTLSIIDQVTLRAHKSQTYKYDEYVGDKRAFNRPNNDRKDYFIGESMLESYPSFIKYSSIKNDPSIVINDCFIISCTVTND